MQRVAVFSGAFDPIHAGHLRVMEDVLTLGKADQVLLLPNAAPPYAKPQASLHHVRAMVRMAIDGISGVALAEPSLHGNLRDTVEALEALRKHMKPAQLLYIIGADKLAGLLHWRRASRLFALCDVLVYPRAGYDGRELVLFSKAHGIRAELLPGAPVEVRSADVRTLVQQFSDAQGLILRSVAKHIALHGLYQPPYERMLKEQLPPKRFAHTLGVRDLAVDLAYTHGLNMQKAAVAALMHDCAKDMKLSQLQAIAAEYRLTDDPLKLASNALLHGPVGAVMARAKYGVTDAEVLGAIRWHTTGRPGMTPLELCLFVADKAEAGRADYPGLQEIRQLMRSDLRLAALHSMRGTAAHVQQQGLPFGAFAQSALDDLVRAVRPL